MTDHQSTRIDIHRRQSTPIAATYASRCPMRALHGQFDRVRRMAEAIAYVSREPAMRGRF
jgi:hypothetical protein